MFSTGKHESSKLSFEVDKEESSEVTAFLKEGFLYLRIREHQHVNPVCYQVTSFKSTKHCTGILYYDDYECLGGVRVQIWKELLIKEKLDEKKSIRS